MMGSQLATIVTTIGAMTITGYAYDVHVGDEMRNHFDIANVPCRVINAIGFSSSMTKTQTFGSGHVVSTEWTITDIALIRKAGMGLGLKDIQPDVQGYLAAYHDAVRTLVTNRWVLTRCQLRSSVLEWPQASGSYYDAVTATLTITEIVE
jgi:hypothetical protein